MTRDTRRRLLDAVFLVAAFAVLAGALLLLQERLDPAGTRAAREPAPAAPITEAPSAPAPALAPAAPVPEAPGGPEAPAGPAQGGTPGPTQGSAEGPARRGGVPGVDPAWVTRTANLVGIPAPALAAYARATLRAPEACGIGWTTLAGIGWVESQHGTIGGRTLGADGRSSTRILGPALDGRGDLAAIPATSATTRWHGNAAWDHAVGPMQFIPTSWVRWSADGDGDGDADPNDLDDAALAAARYLCADGHDLVTGEGWSAAVFSYNHAQAYVAAVHVAATTYAARAS